MALAQVRQTHRYHPLSHRREAKRVTSGNPKTIMRLINRIWQDWENCWPLTSSSSKGTRRLKRSTKRMMISYPSSRRPTTNLLTLILISTPTESVRAVDLSQHTDKWIQKGRATKKDNQHQLRDSHISIRTLTSSLHKCLNSNHFIRKQVKQACCKHRKVLQLNSYSHTKNRENNNQYSPTQMIQANTVIKNKFSILTMKIIKSKSKMNLAWTTRRKICHLIMRVSSMMRIKKLVIWKETSRRWMSNTTMMHSTAMVAIDRSITMMKSKNMRTMERRYKTVCSKSICLLGIVMPQFVRLLIRICKKAQYRFWIRSQWIGDQSWVKNRTTWERASANRTNPLS